LSLKLSQISVETLKGVGPKVAEKLALLSINNLEDLLFHLPSRYQDRSRIHPIGNLLHGQTAQVFGMIEAADIVFGKRRSLVCKISDASGILDIRLFYFSMAQKKQFKRGEFVQCYGQVSHSGRAISMIHPEITFLKNQQTPKLEAGLQAVYPTTQGLQQRTFQSLLKQTMDSLNSATIKELLPQDLLEKLNFPPLADALRLLHRPPLDISLADIQSGEHPLIQRLAFEELMAQHLALKKLKQKHQAHHSYAIPNQQEVFLEFEKKLPFALTGAQQKVITEIRNDLDKDFPMMRLVQGDVGCGKTLVAAFAMLDIAANDFQSVLMAPTELLAEQHFVAFQGWFESFGIPVTLLTSKMSNKQKIESLNNIKTGAAKIVIGTHAVFQQQVEFSHLALVVIDEQHRFGVEQRKSLLEKGFNSAENNASRHPHQLIMTATPIPRTLAQTAYADLDLSIIDEMPPGRKLVGTSVISDLKRAQVIQRIRHACQQDQRQIYWVCTLIDESEELEYQAAEATYQELSEQLAELRVGLVHGRLKSKDKHLIMAQFKAGELDILVATTVIEVGVDVPNASLMIIENPERLGLSQLHQLRGRVGRGEKQSYCILMYHAPLSQNAKQRLNVMRDTNDGFKIAEKDLEIRGAGEVLGTRQTGEVLFRFADLLRDRKLLPQVHQNAEMIANSHPELVEALCARWIKDGEQLSHV
jgi:ATP-dependent DNA helicase RecG